MNAMGFAIALAIAATTAGTFLAPRAEPTALARAEPTILDARRDVERTPTHPSTAKSSRVALASYR